MIRSRILRAAIRLFAERGYWRTTLEDVARAARCSETELNFAFPTKADLFLACLYALDTSGADRRILDLVRSAPDFKIVAVELAVFMCRLLDKTHARIRIFGYLERPDLMSEFIDQATRRHFDALRDRIRIERMNGNVRDGVDTDIAVTAFSLLCLSRHIYSGIGTTHKERTIRRTEVAKLIELWTLGVLSR